ncbi:MAG: DsbA family protein [Candidatus Sungbacteria bacterium]|nr:DsbA family protein [Candidatus Sungbacteria bacterium]
MEHKISSEVPSPGEKSEQPAILSAHNSGEGDKFILPGAIVTAGVIVAVAILYTSGAFDGKKEAAVAGGGVAVSEASDALQKNIEDDDPALGNPDAPVVLVEFSDFQCPFCRKLWRESFFQLKEKYIKTGKVRFVYRDFPLSGIHSGALPAAMAGECAEDQNKFWEMHDKIFQEQDRLGQGTVSFTADDLKRWARELGLDGSAFDSCFDGGKYRAEVEKDYSDGTALGVAGTPHIFVNGKPLIRGALPFEQIDQIIQQELAGR